MITLAIGVSLAFIATAVAGFAAPVWLGRSLGAFELTALFCGLIAVGWGASVLHRRRTRRRLMDMRDSALW